MRSMAETQAEIDRAHPTLHCTVCHRDQANDGMGWVLGWPKCCGYTMTLDGHSTRCNPGGVA